MNKNIIFYFSGTGNSLQVARDIAEKVGDCEVINLAKYNVDNEINAERVGIVFPVYFWGIPNIIKTFLKSVKFTNSPYIFAVATCGGVEGASLIQVRDLLRSKKQDLHSGFIILMPDNYIVLYDPVTKEKEQTLFENEKAKVKAISDIVLHRKIQPAEKGKSAITRLLGKTGNNIFSKGFPTRDTKFNLGNQCTGCGKCEKVCSVGNIRMVDRKPTWNHNCEYCLACINHCPVKAINFKNSTQKRGRYTNPHVSMLQR